MKFDDLNIGTIISNQFITDSNHKERIYKNVSSISNTQESLNNSFNTTSALIAAYKSNLKNEILTDPIRSNCYIYANLNPLIYFDPDGRLSCKENCFLTFSAKSIKCDLLALIALKGCPYGGPITHMCYVSLGASFLACRLWAFWDYKDCMEKCCPGIWDK